MGFGLCLGRAGKCNRSFLFAKHDIKCLRKELNIMKGYILRIEFVDLETKVVRRAIIQYGYILWYR